MMIAFVIALAAADAPPLRQGLEPLGFLVGHCWRGEFETREQDTHCFEAVYDGQHVRDRHEVTGGKTVYRGETLYSWDGAQKAASYTYWNSLGGVSRGTMRPKTDRLDFGDETYRGPDGKEAKLSTYWRRVGDDSYEAVTVSPQMPSMNRTVRYIRVPAVSISETRDGSGNLVLVHEVTVAATPAEVWEAIATPKGWTGWAVPVAWSEGDILETSYTPTARPGDATNIKQQFTVRIPERLLAFRTVKAPEGFPNFDTFRRVDHVIELEPAGEGRTKIRLTGAGYPDTQAGRQLLAFFREGNRVSLERLRQRVEIGPVDWSRLAAK